MENTKNPDYKELKQTQLKKTGSFGDQPSRREVIRQSSQHEILGYLNKDSSHIRRSSFVGPGRDLSKDNQEETETTLFRVRL